MDSKERYYYLKDRGLCVCCGKDYAMDGLTVCPECGFRKAETQRIRRLNQTNEQRMKGLEWRKINRDKNRAAGLCSCGKEREDKQYKLCRECRLYYRRKKREKAMPKMWMELGLCRWCGKEVVDGYKYCQEHLERVRKQTEKNFRPYGLNIAYNNYIRRLNRAFWEERTAGKVKAQEG